MIEISKKLKIPPATLLSILNSLVQKGFIYRDNLSLRYHMGWKVAHIASRLNQTDLVLRVAIPVINEKLRPFCEETISMSVLDGRDVRFIYVNRGSNSNDLQVVQTIGGRLPAYAAGSGRSMMAFMPKDEVVRLFPEVTFDPITDKTRTSKQDFLNDLESIRQKGYIYDEEESEKGVWAACSCLRDKQNHPLAGIAIVVPMARMDDNNRKEWASMLVDAVKEINRRLS